MSGFVAIVNTDGSSVAPPLLGALLDSLKSRGPDGTQTRIEGCIGMGHALFRTTDEAEYENQPSSLDGKSWITGCIRIDARAELLNKMGLQKELRLDRTPDSLLVLHAYSLWGEHCVQHMIGDFSFALWDSARRVLFCARDHFGMRQLCYTRQGDSIIVSNSIDCIRRHPAVTDRVADAPIADFLLFGDHRWQDKAATAFCDIKCLEPATTLSVNGKSMATRRYWQGDSECRPICYRRNDDYIDHFAEIFTAAVKDRLRTNSVSVSLSGGMDSTSIAAVMRDIRRASVPGLDSQAAAVLFDSIHDSDERRYLQSASKHLGISPHVIDGGDYPLLSPALLTTCPIELYQPRLWLDFERHIAANSRVLITGDAGDEVFKFSSMSEVLKNQHPLRAAADFIFLSARYGRYPGLGTGLKAEKRQGAPYPYPDWISRDLERSLDLRNRWRDYWSGQPRAAPGNNAKTNRQILAALTSPDWNTDDIYMSCDFALPEKRSPFLDLRLIRFLLSIPALPWLFNKHLLREAMRDKLPKDVLRRPKVALGAIHDSLLKEGIEDFPDHRRYDGELFRYVDKSWKTSLLEPGVDSSKTYVNLRPLILDTWLRLLRSGAPGT